MPEIAPSSAATASHIRAFDAVAWEFDDAAPNREFHPYPARFIPQIPAQALDVLDVEGRVLDPFCGSGTTLLESSRRGLPATGIDLNPIACLISRVRTQPWRSGDAQAGLAHARALRERSLGGGDLTGLSEQIPRLGHWFDEWAQEALAGAVGYLGEIQDSVWRDRVAVAISSTVVRIGRQESDTRYAAITKRGDRVEAARLLGQSVVRVCDWLAAHGVGSLPSAVEVHCQDARTLSDPALGEFSAAVFSPPYPNAYEYWLYHKYRMYWLGFDPIRVRRDELGARPHYCKPNGMTAGDFAGQMADVFAGLALRLVPEAPVVIVVGDSVIRGESIDNGALLIKAASTHGFTLGAHRHRRIGSTRSSFNRAHGAGRRPTEHVLLLHAPA